MKEGAAAAFPLCRPSTCQPRGGLQLFPQHLTRKLKNYRISSADADESDPELARVASLGFTGCLSVVRFNSINPLKAALLHPDRSPVVVTGPLVRSGCGSSASANAEAADDAPLLPGESRRDQTCSNVVCCQATLT